MSCTLDLKNLERHVVATFSGTRTPEALLEVATATIGHCREHEMSLVLLDLRPSSGGLDTIETYEIAGHSLPRQDGARQLARLAILDRPENLERIRFFETVAVNRGLAVRSFGDEEHALRWLFTKPGTEQAD
ncbi:MAG: hypothetical protein V2I67_11415 [Thermoanaerobaculales bacterium]|jgi:hypothetical protein|nr:hypothetical protein [Thermoanaerobaculales bacterium]